MRSSTADDDHVAQARTGGTTRIVRNRTELAAGVCRLYGYRFDGDHT